MILYRGSVTDIERVFDDVSGVTVVAKDFNGLTIPTTSATYVGGVWRTTLSIPAGAPVVTATSGYYKLIWTHAGGTTEQDFQVVAYDEGVQRPPPAAFGVLNVSLLDILYLPAGTINVKCEILGMDGTVVVPDTLGVVTLNSVTTPTPDSPGSIKASVEFAGYIPGLAVGEWIAHWTYPVGSTTGHEYRQAFVISTKTAGVLSSLRMYLDQSGVTRFLSHFQFTDVELIDCLYRGAARINSHPPQITNYNPDSMPPSLAHPLRVAALHEMLNRLYLAEGMSAFDFQGGSIQVNVDRTQFIQTKMDELNSWLDSNLTQVKSVTMARSSVGILHLSMSTGGVNNNYGSRSRILNPQTFNLVRQFGLV